MTRAAPALSCLIFICLHFGSCYGWNVRGDFHANKTICGVINLVTGNIKF